MNQHQPLPHRIQRTLSHDSTLRPAQASSSSSHRHHSLSINQSVLHDMRLLRNKIAKKLLSTVSPREPRLAVKRVSISKNVFEFEEDSLDGFGGVAEKDEHEKDEVDEYEEDTVPELSDKENYCVESIGKRISCMAKSIVAKDGRELFGELPSRRIPIASIVRNQICFQ